MRVCRRALGVLLAGWIVVAAAMAQEYGKPDRGEPGDRMIQEYLARQAEKLEGPWLEGVKSRADWEKLRPKYVEEYFYMLGLWPLPPKTPLEATVTGTLPGEGYVVEKLHYQSRPHLYVTGNLYRPAKIKPGERLPAVLLRLRPLRSGARRQQDRLPVARHLVRPARVRVPRGRFAPARRDRRDPPRHVPREAAGGGTRAATRRRASSAWNGMRGIDYLQSRPDVDPQRIAVTGISGGGAATFWIAAADERVKVAVPVSGMADLRSYVGNRVINGHCDCMFLYNTFQWPWTRIAALIAPRPMLFTNSDADAIFPMDANDRVINRLERVYSLFGAGDLVDSLVSIGGHAYRQDIRQAAYRFINIHLKNDPRIVTDSEVDLVLEEGRPRRLSDPARKAPRLPEGLGHPQGPAQHDDRPALRPMAKVDPPKPGEFDAWKSRLMSELRRVSFNYFPDRIPPAKLLEQLDPNEARLETEPGIEVRLRLSIRIRPDKQPYQIVLTPWTADGDPPIADSPTSKSKLAFEPWYCLPRGVGPTRWTEKDPPNYVKRSHALLGRTVDAGRVWDIVAVVRYLRAKYGGAVPIHVHGQGGNALLAACAAVLEPEIGTVTVDQPPVGFMAPDAPQLLNVLRVCDVPELLGMLAPRPLTIYAGKPIIDKVAAAYAAAGKPDKLVVKPK